MTPEKHTIRRQKAFLRRQGKRACFVYGLKYEGQIFYVGQTRCALSKRLRLHYRSASSTGSAVERWLLGKAVEIIMVERSAVWDVDEVIWIDRLRQKGEPLLNVRRGGKD